MRDRILTNIRITSCGRLKQEMDERMVQADSAENHSVPG